MPLSDFAPLLGELALAFGEPVIWRGGEFVGRLRIDPFAVPLGITQDAGLDVTETWLYCERRTIPTERTAGKYPDVGDLFIIRDWLWEIASVGDDDIDERQFRLLRVREAPPPEMRAVIWDRPPTPGGPTSWDDAFGGPAETEWEDQPIIPGHKPPSPPWYPSALAELAARRPPGRPTRAAEIAAAYAAVAPRYPPTVPLKALVVPIRREITGRDTPSVGLADDTLARAIGRLRRKAQNIPNK